MVDAFLLLYLKINYLRGLLGRVDAVVLLALGKAHDVGHRRLDA